MHPYRSGQFDEKGGAFLFAAFQPDVTAVELDDLLGDEQAQASGDFALQAGAAGGVELVEEVVVQLAGDADARVLHREAHLALVLAHAHGDGAAGGRKLEGIV